MDKSEKKISFNITVIAIMAFIVVCFFISLYLIQSFAKDFCFDRIEETAMQMANMVNRAMEERQDKLTVFADILAANNANPDDLLQKHMETFCNTQQFTSVCIHRESGRDSSYGEHPHDKLITSSFTEEAAKVPYTSDVFSYGSAPEDNYIYQAVPIVRGGKTIAILYGYTSLDILPHIIASGAYDGKNQFYVVDGSTGQFLMDEHRGELGNIYDGTLGELESRKGYDLNKMFEDVRNGRSGFFVCGSKKTDIWYYTYYMPLAISNWSIQLSVDEQTGFADFISMSRTMQILMVLVNGMILALIVVLTRSNMREKRRDKQRLHNMAFVNEVQIALISAHNDPDFVSQALKLIQEEYKAETTLLLTFRDKVIVGAQHYPSKDKKQAQALLGVNIRDAFPNIFDALSSGKSTYFGENDMENLSDQAQRIFKSMDIKNILLVPIADNSGAIKGAIAEVNIPPESRELKLLEVVSRDFFMAITNLENYNIIKKMGTIDYLTGMKNRNSFETELADYATVKADTLWCAYIDVTGLHELNNTQGHKAGDLLLFTVADNIKRVFGTESSYRIGGDEFVVFKADSSHEEFMSYKYRMLDELAKKGYNVSVGFDSVGKNQNKVFDVDELMTKAEQIMYKDKREYYQKQNIPYKRTRNY